MRNRIIAFAAAMAFLSALAFTAYSLFEVVPVTRYMAPSREARINDYLALDLWLESGGIPVRLLGSGDFGSVRSAEEGLIFIQSSMFHWTDEAGEYLASWVEEGGRLFLALDFDPDADWYYDVPRLLLDDFGIEVEAEHGTGRRSIESPGYDRRISFNIAEEASALSLKDHDNITRLVQVKRGKGELTVMGRPLFLRSELIGDAPNARLAWGLFAGSSGSFDSAESEGPGLSARGVLFIRGTAKVSGLLGSLFRQGNLGTLIASVLVLLIIGFWAVIPTFGLVFDDRENQGKLLRERFLAEGRFLKNFGALEHYTGVYIKEIRRRFALKEGIAGDGQILIRIQEILDKEKWDGALPAEVFPGGPVRYRDFHKTIVMLKKILERI